MEFVRNKEQTKRCLLDAVDSLVEESGYEALGINAVAAKAGVSKMLIYRYFGSLEGLIAAYIQQYDYWINFNGTLPSGREGLGPFIKEMFHRQITFLRENYTLRRLYRWELSHENSLVEKLRQRREKKGVWLVEAVSRLSGHPRKEVAAIASVMTAAISYLVLLEENCLVYNGISIQEEAGWEQIEEGIDLMVDLWINKK